MFYISFIFLSLFSFLYYLCFFFFGSRRRHTSFVCDWSSDVCSSDLAAMVSLVSTGQDFRYLVKLVTPSRWTPIAIHQAGIKLAQIAGPGPVLTLAPVIPLEGGLDIYRALATAPFAWKTAGFLSEKQRQEFRFVGPQNVASALESHHPGAI